MATLYEWINRLARSAVTCRALGALPFSSIFLPLTLHLPPSVPFHSSLSHLAEFGTFSQPFIKIFWFFIHTHIRTRNSDVETYTLCLRQKVPTFKLSVTLSNLSRSSQFLHCWNTYGICCKNDITHLTLCMLLHYLGKLKIQNFCRCGRKHKQIAFLIA